MVSVIIPIYNIADVLEKCVKSVLQQTYSNLEILLVDDGSTDESANLCDKFAELDHRVQALHKKNGGLSDARNFGLAHAHGQYIFYLDGDDWLAENAIRDLRDQAIQSDSDIVQCEYYYAYEDYLLVRKEFGQVIEYTKEEALKELLSNGLIKNFAWGNLMKKELAEKVSFLKGKYFEDSYWKYQILHLAKHFVYIPNRLVYYRQRSNSISSALSARNMDLLKGNAERLAFIKDHYPQLYNQALREHWLHAFQFMKWSENSDRQTADLFKTYLDEFTSQNQASLAVSLKEDSYKRILFFIYNHCMGAYTLFSLLERIYNRFAPNTYTVIKS